MAGSVHKIRIVGGLWRSRQLKVLSREGLRPTPDRVRETLFNWLGQTLPGGVYLDLFAGSGALGFEAASRGAQNVVLVEQDLSACKYLQQARLELPAPQVTVERTDAMAFIRSTSLRFDGIFLDPPYQSNLLKEIESVVPKILNTSAWIYLESPQSVAQYAGFSTIKSAKAGAVHYHLLRNPTHSS